MSIDARTRLHKDVRALERDEVFDSVLPDAIAVHGDLAGRGVAYKELPAVGLDVDGRCVTLRESGGTLAIREGLDDGRRRRRRCRPTRCPTWSRTPSRRWVSR